MIKDDTKSIQGPNNKSEKLQNSMSSPTVKPQRQTLAVVPKLKEALENNNEDKMVLGGSYRKQGESLTKLNQQVTPVASTIQFNSLENGSKAVTIEERY